ncbi:LuxR C-terminal-related transcriptional regulator [Streptomyces sp. UNOC14_S4]|uniref:helix-turn-helix transcriptional regulator n=1 Tax=Streptomyces sp. UNOC14_S4 TaxID=2872340 RepID=UPI0023AFB8A1|nr:LuxR C-terminal-related transcriptional regulator [Streptomyces sp. UNOC14_S4]MCC3769980.1 LuxR C-terminal-related transcriptional regulator [Streptomyces sp. UNOC14_S4]
MRTAHRTAQQPHHGDVHPTELVQKVAPLPENRCFGRDAELRAVIDKLADPTVRLLTLTGPAGVGKSRLSREAAALVAPAFDDHVPVVELADLDTAPAAWSRISRALGGKTTAETPEGVAEAIADRELLLVLDNCDLLTASLSLGLAWLINNFPGLRVMATSRTSINVYAEHLFLVRPLPVDGGAAAEDAAPVVSDAALLFVDRLGGHYRDHVLLDDDLTTVTEICELLDGLPLAIELTARSIGTLTLRAALDHLRQGRQLPYTDRLLDIPTRQRSMESSLFWADGLLSAQEQELLQRLSLFEGPFSIAAARRVGGLSRDRTARGLDELIHKSLLLLEHDDSGEQRLWMLASVRRYYRKRLTSNPCCATDARRRHAHLFTESISARELARLTPEQRAATVSGRLPDILAAIASLGELGEHIRLLELVLALESVWTAGHHLAEVSAHTEASVAALRAEDLPPGTAPLLGRALEAAGRWRAGSGSPERARALWQAAMTVYQEHGHRAGLLRVTAHLGELEREACNSEKVLVELCAAASELAELGDEHGAALALRYSALAQYEVGSATAESALRRSITAFRALGDEREQGLSLLALARIQLEAGQPEQACSEVRSAMRMLRHTGGPGDVALALEILGCALSAAGDDEEQQEPVARLLLTARTLRERHRLPPGKIDTTVQSVERRRRATLGTAAFARLGRRLYTVRVDSAIQDALSLPVQEPLPRSGPKPSGTCLTPRQTEIALMVAEGMTNRQIASRLSLSEWTVVNHLRQVMQKLQAPSRVHVARVMQQSGS